MATHVDTSYTSRNAHIYNFSQSDCGHRQHNKGASNTSSASDTQALSEATHRHSNVWQSLSNDHPTSRLGASDTRRESE